MHIIKNILYQIGIYIIPAYMGSMLFVTLSHAGDVPSLAVSNAHKHHDTHVFRTIAQAHQKEAELNDTHFCLYHGMNKAVFVDMLANTYLDHFINGTSIDPEFIKVRHNEDLYDGDKPVSHTISHKDATMKELLFVNMSFPGCLAIGADTLHYFRDESYSWTFHDGIAHFYASDEKEKHSITSVLRDISNRVSHVPCGVLLQVCIPKDIVHTCMYFCEGGGTPKSLYQSNFFMDSSQYTRTILDAYQHNQRELYDTWKLDPKELQACIRLDARLFGKPGRIKIFAYHAFPQSIYHELYDRLQRIVCEKS